MLLVVRVTELENRKDEKVRSGVSLFPLVRGSEWGPDYVVCRVWDML